VNRIHRPSALIAFATAWLRCHYPAEFYMAILNSWPMGFYLPATLVYDARRQGVEVRPPCLKEGDWECTVEGTTDPRRPALRIGWRHVRGMGERTLERLRQARAAGPFASVEDVVRRAALTRFEALALARGGAFGAWEPDRRHAAWEALRVVGDGLPVSIGLLDRRAQLVGTVRDLEVLERPADVRTRDAEQHTCAPVGQEQPTHVADDELRCGADVEAAQPERQLLCIAAPAAGRYAAHEPRPLDVTRLYLGKDASA
jgi:hypothetical protein